MNHKRNHPGPIPKRWLNCPRKADRLIIDKFMAFKTPLDEKFDSQVPADCRFYPRMFFDICKKKKIKFGLWIDLTNTKRFYDKAEVEESGCKYVKLSCRGHGETPSIEQTEAFVKLCKNFIAQNPLKCIAVHCTHGFNRTGFLIISYLVKELDFSLDVALQMFTDARPIGIYKQDYLNELYRRYDDVEETPPAPQLPDWCHDEDEDVDDDSTSTSSSNTNEDGKQSKFKKQAVFMEGVHGVTLFTEQPKTQQLQEKIRIMCGYKSHKHFPGCQPVSMDKKNIELLHKHPYRVSWKADGTRYMMLIDGEKEVYFFDRNNAVFKVHGLRFVYRKDLRRHLKNTLIDGEMVIDKVGEESIPRYLAYDIINFEDQNVGELPFYPSRLQCLDVEIIKPRYAAMEKQLINKATEPFSVRKKDFWPITQTVSLLGEKFAKSLSHEPDGLIYQPSKDPYIAGRCDAVLKWKPLTLNSVDFQLRIISKGGPGIIPVKKAYLFVLRQEQPFSEMQYTKSLKDLDGKIIECKYENGQWAFMRERTDKSHPNSVNTARAVCETIKDPITEDELIDYIQRYGYSTEDADMMPPPVKIAKR